MRAFTAVDGFVEVADSIGEMIKYVANEPSMGLFYVQQHAQKAIPNVVKLKSNVLKLSHETNLHTQDLDDSVEMVKTMKQCGVRISDEMVSDLKKSLALISKMKPNMTHKGTPVRSSSWKFSGSFSLQNTSNSSGYFTSMFRTAKEKAGSFKWSEMDSVGAGVQRGIVRTATSDSELDELPLSSQESGAENLPDGKLLDLESYEEFKAGKEANLVEWLENSTHVDK